MNALFEAKPRWKGAVFICLAQNLLAFKDRTQLHVYRESIGMSAYSPRKVWLCDTCGHWHYEGRSPDPSGDSSGTGRSRK